GERERQLDRLDGLAAAAGFVLADAAGAGGNRALDELDQPFVHLRLGGGVPVERGLGGVELLGQRRGGDALPFRRLEHVRERFQDLEPAFAFGAGHGGKGPTGADSKPSPSGTPSGAILSPSARASPRRTRGAGHG